VDRCVGAECVWGGGPSWVGTFGYSPITVFGLASEREARCVMHEDGMHGVRSVSPLEGALGFVPCDGCDWDFETGEGLAPCGRYFCPKLPELLDVRCPTCLFNFVTGASNSQCGEVHTCRFSHEQAPARVELFRRWLASHPRKTPAPAR
jgi:hypothetical protein